jgi:hypothetical protein
MKKGPHIGVVSGNMFFQITNGGVLGFLSKKRVKTPLNGHKIVWFGLIWFGNALVLILDQS